MNQAKTTPKDFFLWAGAMVSLFGSIGAFIGLVFDYINYAFPDPLAYYSSNPYQNGVAYEMSSFLILGAVCLILLRVIHRSIEKDATRAEVWVRRWALFLTLFVAGASIVIDLIVVMTSFLNGEELSTRFLLKVLIVLLVAATGFMHFLADLWGYWTKNPALSMRVSAGVAVLGVLTIAAGFLILGTPMHARLVRLDEQKINDLSSIQDQVVQYWQTKRDVPQELSDLSDSLGYYTVPRDPQNAAMYEYTRISATSFELCATFNTVGSRMYAPYSNFATDDFGGKGMDAGNWTHGTGRTCFDRTIDPSRYPPTPAKSIN